MDTYNQVDAQAFELPSVMELKESAIHYKLEHADVLLEYDDDTIYSEFNGVGPDRWSPALRNVLTWILRDVLEGVLVHDLDYHKGGDEQAFHESNRALGKNTRKLARKKYGWWRPRRWFLVKLSYKLTEWTDRYGWEGWNKK